MLTRLTAHCCRMFQVSALALALTGGTSVARAGDPPPSVPKLGGTPQPIATVQLKPGELPQIKFDEPIFEFGRVPAGKDVLHDYWFTNTGNGPLEILLIKPSCGCTTAGDFDRVVQPGRKGRIPVKVSTAHVAGGIMMKTVTVQTNVAPPGNSTVLSLRGEIWKAVQATPASLYFGQLMVGDDANRKVVMTTEIATAGGAVITPGNLKTSNPSFQPELTEVERGAKYKLTVTATPPFRLGSNFATIELSTGVVEVPALQVPCTLLVSPELEVTPDKLLVPVAGASTTRPIQIRNNGKTLMQLSNAVCSNPTVSVQLREVQPGRSWTIMVDVPAGYRRSAPEGDIVTVDTNQSDRSRITVPLIENKLYREPEAAPTVTTTSVKSGGAAKAPVTTTKPTDVSRVP